MEHIGDAMPNENACCCAKIQPWVLSILRIAVAVLFMQHGGQKLLGYPPTDHAMTLTPLLWVAGILELGGGALVLIGLLTRPAAFILSGEMAAAYFMAHASKGLWPVVNHGELAVVYCFVFLYLAAAGAGPLSLDALVWKKAAK